MAGGQYVERHMCPGSVRSQNIANTKNKDPAEDRGRVLNVKSRNWLYSVYARCGEKTSFILNHELKVPMRYSERDAPLPSGCRGLGNRTFFFLSHHYIMGDESAGVRRSHRNRLYMVAFPQFSNCGPFFLFSFFFS